MPYSIGKFPIDTQTFLPELVINYRQGYNSIVVPMSVRWETKLGGPIKKSQNSGGGNSAKIYSSKTFEKFWQVYKKFAHKFKKFEKKFFFKK